MQIDTSEEQHYLVPEHLVGIQKDLTYSIGLESGEDADDWFVETMDRLLKINDWTKYYKNPEHSFQLTDHHGKKVTRRAHTGDHIVIRSLVGSDNLDPHWMQVVAIEYDDYPDNDRETIALHIQPSNDPMLSNGRNDNFHNKEASGTLVIERLAKRITINYHSRNDISNTSTGEIVAAMITWFSITDAEWESLLKGLIE